MKINILKFSLALSILLVSIDVLAQDLFVYHITGEIYYSDLKNKNKQVFYNYKTLPSTVFKLEERSELILRDKDYNLLILKSKGSYTANNLVGIFNRKDVEENFAKTTIAFLSSELVRSEEDIQEYAENYLRQSGGVSRGNCLDALMISPMNGQVLTDSVLSFKWKESTYNPIYELQITDGSSDSNNEEILFYSKVEGATELVLKVESLSFLKENQNHSWSVNPIKEPHCGRFNFRLTSKEKIQSLKDLLLQSVDTSQSLADQLVELASLYETNGLLQESVACYDFAFTLTENQAFLTLRKLLIARHQ